MDVMDRFELEQWATIDRIWAVVQIVLAAVALHYLPYTKVTWFFRELREIHTVDWSKWGTILWLVGSVVSVFVPWWWSSVRNVWFAVAGAGFVYANWSRVGVELGQFVRYTLDTTYGKILVVAVTIDLVMAVVYLTVARDRPKGIKLE